jgi:hypothetical protein
LGLVAGFCKNGNEPSESMSIKGREFFDWLSVLSASQDALCLCSFFVTVVTHGVLYLNV